MVANTTKSNFKTLSAVTSGINDIRQIIAEAKNELDLYNKRTILFIDEIHRFNKTQQDALLPAVENGTVVLIGATTENPYFEVNSALLSRSRIFKLEALSEANIRTLLENAVQNKERGLGEYNIKINEDAMEHWLNMCGGDIRAAYNALELAVLTTVPNSEGIRHIDIETAAESIQRKALQYDKNGDYHYDIVSAFIKSMRGSDSEATLHWLARMIVAGESPEFIMRRILICAAEDVGLADPNALSVAVSAMEAARYVGWPEARIPVAMAALYVANAPKSNAAYLAINRAIDDVKNMKISGVPMHLRDASYSGAKNFGHGSGYKYPHDYPNAQTEQEYLPPELKNAIYYEPKSWGFEADYKKNPNRKPNLQK